MSLLRYPRKIFLPNIIIVKCANIFVILDLGLLRSQDDAANHLAMAMLFIFSWLSYASSIFGQKLIAGAQGAQLRGALLIFSRVIARRRDLAGMAVDFPMQVERKLQSLNNFLGRTSDRSVSPARSQCKSEALPGAHY